jgi:hypothetical protein
MMRHLTHLEVALRAEELQMEADIRTYDQFNVSLEYAGVGNGSGSGNIKSNAWTDREDKHFVWLEVPGVGERRPALNLRDVYVHTISCFECALLIPPPSSASGRSVTLLVAEQPDVVRIQCYVWKVEEKRVLLSFPIVALAQLLCISSDDVLARRHYHGTCCAAVWCLCSWRPLIAIPNPPPPRPVA